MAKRVGRKSKAQTPAPKKERIFGSKKNPKGSASSEKSASKIRLNKEIIKGLENKLAKFKEENPNKKNVNLNDLKAVFRRGLGAYSSSHRPTITGGVPNTRNAWAFARVNKFLKKASGEKVKKAYVQDDDLMAKGGKVKSINDFLDKRFPFLSQDKLKKDDIVKLFHIDNTIQVRISIGGRVSGNAINYSISYYDQNRNEQRPIESRRVDGRVIKSMIEKEELIETNLIDGIRYYTLNFQKFDNYANGGEVKFNQVLIYKEEQGNWFTPKNTIYGWLYDDPNAFEKLESGEYDYIIFPPQGGIGLYGQKGYVPPLQKIWRKSYQDKKKGSNKLIGIVQGWYDEEDNKLYVEMMTTRKDWRRKGVNSYIIQEIRKDLGLEKEQVEFVNTTKEGKKFEESGNYANGGEIPKYRFVGEQLESDEVEAYFDSDWKRVYKWDEGKGRGISNYTIYYNGDKYLLEMDFYGFDDYISRYSYIELDEPQLERGGEINGTKYKILKGKDDDQRIVRFKKSIYRGNEIDEHEAIFEKSWGRIGGQGWAHINEFGFTYPTLKEAIKSYLWNKTNNYANGGELDKKVLRERWAKKKDALENLANNISRLRKNLSQDLRDDEDKVRLTALVIKIMDETGERVGNDDSADNGHFGVTGLKKKHIKVNGSNVKLKYVGKSGVEHEKEFNDSTIAIALKEAMSQSPSEYVFETSDGFRIKNDRVNRYLKIFNVSAKDLRGYSANKWIINKLRSVNDREILNNDAKRKSKFNEIVKSVAEKVGHGSATLKKHYLLPSLEREFVNHGKIVDLSNIKRTYKHGGETDEVNTGVDVIHNIDADPLDELKDIPNDGEGVFDRGGEVNYEIWKQGRFTKVKPDDRVNTMKNLHSFAVSNGLADRIFKSQGGYYVLSREGVLNKVFNNLNLITYKDIHSMLTNPKLMKQGGKTKIKEANKELVEKTDTSLLLPTYTIEDVKTYVDDLTREDINDILDKLNMPFNVVDELGSGANGIAWQTNRGTVLKITKSGQEAYSSYIIFKNQENFSSQAEIYNLFVVIDLEDLEKYYFIEKQLLRPVRDVVSDELLDLYRDIEMIATSDESLEQRQSEFYQLINDEDINLDDIDKEYAEQIFDLAMKVKREAKPYGLNLYDNHSGNVGFDWMGKLYCFDCGYVEKKSFLIGGNLNNKLMLTFKDGGEITQEDKKEIYAKWRKLVNMSRSELERFYNSEEGKVAGLTPQEAEEAGIDSGRESARWIMKMKSTKVADWTPMMWKWAKKQISFISRMSGNKGKLVDENGAKTRKHLSLLIWGHNPSKKAMGGDVEEPCHVCSMSEGGYNQLPSLTEMADGKRFIYREDVFRKGGDTNTHVGSRYMILECMGEGGITDTLNLKVIQSSDGLLPNTILNRPIRNIINRGREMGETFGKTIIGNYKKGGELNPDDKKVKNYFEHKSGDAGGLLVGKRHSEGGIKAINNSTGQPLEMEGGEVVITRGAVSDPTKREFEGKYMTNREILSAINVSGGGVSFAEGGETPERNC